MMVELNGIRYRVEITGNGSPLVLLHGFTGSLDTWTPFIPLFAKEYRVIALDLLGHGATEAPNDPKRYEIEKAADDLMALFDQLAIGDAHLLGYSMGGRLALLTACREPERIRSLMLESSSPGLRAKREQKERMAHDEKLAAFIEEKGVEAFVDVWENIPLFQTQKRLPLDERKKIRASRLKQRERGLANSLRGMGTGKQPSLWEHLPNLFIPTLLLAGEEDHKFVRLAEEMDKLLPQSEKKIIPGCGHAIHIENRRLFASLVLSFLREQN